MEEIKAYIESGILELYAMGILTDREKTGVEEMIAAYPEVRAELEEIEKALERYALLNERSPADELRAGVLEHLVSSSPEVAVLEIAPAPEEEAAVRTLPRAGSSPFYKYAFAASVAILLLSWASLFVLYNRLQESRIQLTALQSANQQFATRANFTDKQLAEKTQIISVLTDPNFKMIDLKGTSLAPEASMKVAFNPKAKEVMIDLTALKMPVNDKEHQYQLWALVDGKPVDLGVFDAAADSTGMLKMKEIGIAQKFAVTLEPRGGSEIPTQTQLMVVGNVGS